MIENDLISIIVPVYNVKEYLEESLNSAIAQTYSNLEIILVDDGSTDGCSKICDEYAKTDKRIRVIHKENGGLSDARNKGIDIATGEYIFFVDSDDVLQYNTIELLYDAISSQNSISICGHEKFEDEYKVDSKKRKEHKYSVQSFFESILKLKNDTYAWGTLIPRSFLEDIRFPKGRNFEDLATMYKLYFQADNIIVIGNELYKYRKRSGSIVKSSTEKNANDYINAVTELTSFIKKTTAIDRKIINTFLINSYYSAALLFFNEKYIEVIESYKFKEISLKGMTLKCKIKTIIIMLFPQLIIQIRAKKRR